MSLTHSANVPLKYLPEHRLLLCVSCTYCILPAALERHLKDIHKQPQHECRRLAEATRSFDLATADEVVQPAPGSPALPDLPVYEGFSCTQEGCSHACMTVKRMQAHWRNIHGRTAHSGARGSFWRPARLQTFFRGNNLRYFVVDGEAAPPEAAQIERHNASTLEDDLFRQFHETTYKGLLPLRGSQEAWRDRILEEASEFEWLRDAILSVAASHMAFEHPAQTALCAPQACRYRDRGLHHLRTQNLEIKDENIWAVSNFCRLMPLACIASSRWDTDPLRLEWCVAQRLGRSHLWPFRRLFSTSWQHRDHHSDPYLNPSDQMLASLTELFPMRASTIESSACLHALRELRGAWSMPYRPEHRINFRDASLLWGIRAPSAFFELVQTRSPSALVILAHFCVLFAMAEESHWYMKGYATSLLARIHQSLSPEWLGLLQWPDSRVNVDPNLISQTRFSEFDIHPQSFRDDFELSTEIWDPDHASEISND